MSDRGITITRNAARIRRLPRPIFFGNWSAQYRPTANRLVANIRGTPVLQIVQRNGFSSSSSGRGSFLLISIPHRESCPCLAWILDFYSRTLSPSVFRFSSVRSDASNCKIEAGKSCLEKSILLCL